MFVLSETSLLIERNQYQIRSNLALKLIRPKHFTHEFDTFLNSTCERICVVLSRQMAVVVFNPNPYSVAIWQHTHFSEWTTKTLLKTDELPNGTGTFGLKNILQKNGHSNEFSVRTVAR